MNMLETSTGKSQRPPEPFIKASHWLWNKQAFILSNVILGLALNILGSLLFIPWPWPNNLHGTVLQWIFVRPWILIVVGIFLWLIMFIIYLGSRFAIPVTTSSLQETQGEVTLQSNLRESQGRVSAQDSDEIVQDLDKKVEVSYLERVIMYTSTFKF